MYNFPSTKHMNGQGASPTFPETQRQPIEGEESKPTLLRCQKASLDGLELKLTINNNNNNDVYYMVHNQNFELIYYLLEV